MSVFSVVDEIDSGIPAGISHSSVVRNGGLPVVRIAAGEIVACGLLLGFACDRSRRVSAGQPGAKRRSHAATEHSLIRGEVQTIVFASGEISDLRRRLASI